MQFIDLERLEPHVRDLLPPLEEAHHRVMAEQDPVRRRALIERYRRHWVALRDAFEVFSNGKCWYVDCRNPGINNEIDHYRPKLGVREDPTHPGYYWLAFDWRNFRLSCHRANCLSRNPEAPITGGKADHFPILNPTERARTPNDDIASEQPALLDPTDPIDPTLLWFRPNGEVALSPSLNHDLTVRKRFELTRLHLHLDWPRFREERVVLYNSIRRTVVRGEREAPRQPTFTNASVAFKDVIRDLIAQMDPREEYSAAARGYVKTFRDVWWIRDIVLK